MWGGEGRRRKGQGEREGVSTHTDQTVDQASVEMLFTAPLEGPAGVGGSHVPQDVGQGYEGDQEGEEKEIIQKGGSPGGLDSWMEK